jgi:hypothetical protein
MGDPVGIHLQVQVRVFLHFLKSIVFKKKSFGKKRAGQTIKIGKMSCFDLSVD